MLKPMGGTSINIDRLRTLLAVAETGSLTDAAAEMMMSVSAVSQQISKLENEVKIPLIERLPRGVRLTEAGQALAAHAQTIDRNISAALSEMNEFKTLHRGKLRIATFPTFAASIMPEIIRLYRLKYPEIEIQVKSNRQEGIVDSLLRRESEVATLWDYPWLPFEHPELTCNPLMIEPTMLVVSKEHPLARRKSVRMQELAGEKWITRENHPVFSVLNTICQDAGFTPDIAMLTSDYQELQGMVSAGIGVALAPQLAVANPNPNVRVLKITENPAPRRILLASAKGTLLSPSARGAVEIFSKIAGKQQL